MADSFHVSGRVDGESHGNGVSSDRFYSAATGRLRSANVAKASVIAPPYAIQQLTYNYDAMGNVLMAKRIQNRITLKAQFASDHWRVPNNNFVQYEAMAKPSQFYGAMKVDYSL